MTNRMTDACAFVVILCVCLAGGLKAPWWTAVAGACALTLVSLAERWNSTAAARGPHVTVTDPVQLAASTLNGAAISACAYACGLGLGWAWGI